MSAEPQTSGALAPGQLITDPAIAAIVPNGQVVSGTGPLSTAIAVPAVPVASFFPTAIPSGAIMINDTATGTAAAQAAIQPEVLQVLSLLAPRMGSFDAAIAFMIASATGMAAGGMVPGQVPEHIQW